MLRLVKLLCVFCCSSICFAQEPMEKLPRPHYHAQQADPAWLKYAVQFHGHLGPMLTFGSRMGMAALKAVDAKGYFDVEVTCAGPFVAPPASCFLDGLQIATGATLGKRNLKWTEAEQIAVVIKNTRTGKIAELRPKKEFLALLPQPKGAVKEGAAVSGKPSGDDDHAFDDLARRIAVMPEEEILIITPPSDADSKGS